ncbi:tRNA lysidine(34) synthetase TilS [Metamycoplasma phocicerebrale]|uniref:tRNA(Ile)-lysidine synthase n=1 Tax=Metamycoplasma phocicerebrale TaxID=142649 RepID=A0A3T0TUJ3_9BACT|nr:tRNA lysidine(34) synthetase TilS [Metamycoplasma phocicerebrale]AZZ65693.1 tRNA lysidine(34) synthetase TilS [Metamycoplasma phocicerebrale]
MENNNILKLKQQLYKEFEKYKINLNSKFIIGVSGGPDSMWLLSLLKDLDIYVATVNYNKREDAWKDQKIVEDYCKLNKINYEVLVLKHEENQKGNFQEIARIERYDFYKKLYDKYGVDYLILAHHKDDSLETFLFQKQSNRQPRQYGILINSQVSGMNIFRPMINLWYKSEIKDFCDKNKIEYAIDSTNDQPIYTRNKIRIQLKKNTIEEKNILFNSMININNKLKEKFLVIDKEYFKFAKNNFNYKKINLTHKYINEILFLFIHKNTKNITLSHNKIELLKKFINSEKNYKMFKLSDHAFVYKEDSLLKIKEN